MSDSLCVLLALLAITAWTAFCALANHWTAALTAPTTTDPGRNAHAALTAPQPMPSGRHRAPTGGDAS